MTVTGQDEFTVDGAGLRIDLLRRTGNGVLPLTGTPGLVPAPVSGRAVVVTFGTDDLGRKAQGLDPVAQPESIVDADTYLAMPESNPTPVFTARLASIYGLTDPGQVRGIFRWYQGETAMLGEEERVGNAVIRFSLATGDPVGGSRPDTLAPLATQGVVRSAVGVQVRSRPWGPRSGALVDGATLSLIPPAEGPWYHVDTGSGDGWVSGIWLEIR